MSERVHVVVKGDTLWGLSRHYKVELDELMTLNNLYGRRQHNLSIGQTIKMPDGTGVPDTELTLRILD